MVSILINENTLSREHKQFELLLRCHASGDA
jgi:hypothetical protein